MSKRPTTPSRRQALELAAPSQVQIPMPLLAALEDIEHAFFGVCIEAGKQVLAAMMEDDRAALCDPAYRPDPSRPGRRSGSTESPITLGGRRIMIRRPRVRSVETEELVLPSYRAAAKRDSLDRQTLQAMASGVSTRRYGRAIDRLPPDERERSTSKSSVSRRFVALTQAKLAELLGQPLDELDLRIVMIDGIQFRDHCILVAIGVDSSGKKHLLGLHEGATENAAVARALLADLIERGLPNDRALVFVIDGSRALRSAIERTFGALGLIQRCTVHKRRNVLEHLPPADRPRVQRSLDAAWNAADAKTAQTKLETVARSLERQHAGAAASLREGLPETLTLMRLGLSGTLLRSLRSTNAIESLNDKIASYTRRVKRWRGGSMILRWVGAACLDAKHGFRRVKGFSQRPRLIEALRRHEQTLHGQTKAA